MSTVLPASLIVHVVRELRDRIDERLVVFSMLTPGQHQRLTMAFFIKTWRAGVRHPDL